MSIARREWKSVDELRAWIAQGARVSAFTQDRRHVPDLVIVHQPPASGRANWRVIDDDARDGGAHWSIPLRWAITRAQLQFDLR